MFGKIVPFLIVTHLFSIFASSQVSYSEIMHWSKTHPTCALTLKIKLNSVFTYFHPEIVQSMYTHLKI